jgi:hypothetical protein
MSFPYFTNTTRLNIALAAYWAQSPAPPRILRISRDKSYQTVIQFSCPEAGNHLQGFYVSYRETDSGYWKDSIFFPKSEPEDHPRWGKIYRVTLQDKDQDYFIFGIASLGKNGYRSITTTYQR